MPNRHLSLGVECKQLKFRILLINCCLVVRGSLVVHVRLFFRTCAVLNEERKKQKNKNGPRALHGARTTGTTLATYPRAPQGRERKF